MRSILLVVILGLSISLCESSERQRPAADLSTADPPWDHWASSNPSWVALFPSFRIIDNVYYVGTKGLSSFLITSSEGHVLLDGGLPQNASTIANNIESLGFQLRDVRVLLNSHAHVDHSGGLASLKELTGADVYASAGDRSALEGGFALGSEDDVDLSAPPVVVDRIVRDQEIIQVGEIALKANITPGHTRGCTTWSMSVRQLDRDFDLLFFCSATVAGNSLYPPQYEGIVGDFRRTFQTMRDWNTDIFLANHPSFFNMEDKRKRQEAGDELAFVDPDRLPELLERLEEAFEQSLAEALADQ